MNLNIGIIGTGSAAAVCAASIFKILDENKLNINVSVISNPNIPKMSVGESLSPGLYSALKNQLKIYYIHEYEELDIVIRFGAKHYWENNENNSFDINYLSPNWNEKDIAVHINSEKFSNFVFKRINLLYGNKLLQIHDNIKHISQNDNVAIAHGENNTYSFDYLFDCRGFPTKEELDSGKYNFPEFETVNSVLLFQQHQEYNHPYTEVLFHKNGWQFGINTRNRKAFGYLYNKDITDKEEALKHFKELNKDLPIDNVKELYWPSYSVKKAVDGRVICMGNKLYFYEPIQGIPLHNYFTFTNYVIHKLINNSFDNNAFLSYFTDPKLPFEEMMNMMHTNITRRLYDMVIINYAGNSMNSKFWNTINYKSRQNLSKSPDWINFCHSIIKYNSGLNEKSTVYPFYPPHPGFIIKQYLEGLNVDPEKFINGEYSVPK